MEKRSFNSTDVGIYDVAITELVEAQLYISSKGRSVVNGTVKVNDVLDSFKVELGEDATKLLSFFLLVGSINPETLSILPEDIYCLLTDLNRKLEGYRSTFVGGRSSS